MVYGYGNFGNLSADYARARQEYPREVIHLLFSNIAKNSKILDLGCGTGISSRQVAQRSGVTVVGSDTDALMIEEALKMKDGIQYVVAAAEDLPFDDGAFDVITAFGAFHWFANEQALNEIKRVLVPGGLFFIANKNDIGSFKSDYRRILQGAAGHTLPEIKKNYDPAEIVSDAGFSNVSTHDFPASEFFTLEQALAYFQSVSLWNEVPDDRKDVTINALEKHFGALMKDGFVERKLNLRVIIGTKGI